MEIGIKKKKRKKGSLGGSLKQRQFKPKSPEIEGAGAQSGRSQDGSWQGNGAALPMASGTCNEAEEAQRRKGQPGIAFSVNTGERTGVPCFARQQQPAAHRPGGLHTAIPHLRVLAFAAYKSTDTQEWPCPCWGVV